MMEHKKCSDALVLLRSMKGHLVWLVQLSADNVLRMNFGKSHLRIREPHAHNPQNSQSVIDALEKRTVSPRGQWHLFLSESNWSVTTKFYKCTRSDKNIDKINMTLSQLDGQRLTDVQPGSEIQDWILCFDLGGMIQISRANNLIRSPMNEDVEWTLFLDDFRYISYTNKGNLKEGLSKNLTIL